MDLTRRDFLLGSAATAVATSLPDDAPEALVKAFHKSLSAAQRKEVVLPWTHKHRLHVVNNWNVTKPKIDATDPQSGPKFLWQLTTDEDGKEIEVTQVKPVVMPIPEAMPTGPSPMQPAGRAPVRRAVTA